MRVRSIGRVPDAELFAESNGSLCQEIIRLRARVRRLRRNAGKIGGSEWVAK